MAYTIPALRRAERRLIVDLNPCIAAEAARRFRFQMADTDCERGIGRLQHEAVNAVVVATYHSTHAELLGQIFAVDPRAKVLVEKPPVTEIADVDDLAAALESKRFLEIGYNRRYAWMTRKAVSVLAPLDGPITMTCIVKELRIPANHWYYWPNQGTRVTGNLSHWFDLATLFIRSNPVEIIATRLSSNPGDEVSVTILYDDASMCAIIATDRGSDLKGVQESIELRRAGTTVLIDDFVRLVVADESRVRVTRSRIRDKGHRRMYREFETAILNEAAPQYPVRDLRISTLLYTTATEMLRGGCSRHSLRPIAKTIGGALCSG
jgi:predicted dehydrogenase